MVPGVSGEVLERMACAMARVMRRILGEMTGLPDGTGELEAVIRQEMMDAFRADAELTISPASTVSSNHDSADDGRV